MIAAAWTVAELFFGGRKGAIVAVALGVALLGAAGWIGFKTVQVANLRADVATAKAETDKERAKLATITANRDNLKASLERQNATVDELRTANDALTREANLRAALALARGKAETDKIRSSPAMNPEELNAWFRVHFQ